MRMGRYEEAIGQFEGDDAASSVLAGALARAGRIDEARAILEDDVAAAAASSGNPIDYIGIASGYSALGDIDEAFKWMRRALDERNISAFLLGSDGLFILEEMVGDPRYAAMLEEMGLRESGQR